MGSWNSRFTKLQVAYHPFGLSLWRILLHRAMVKKVGTNFELLCHTARELLATVVTLVGQRARVVEMSSDLAWVVSS